MKDKKNAPTGAATSAGAKMEAGIEQATTSNEHDTTTRPLGQAVHIADFLSHGVDHGVHLSDLAQLTGLPERTVRQMIHQERRRHIPILSNNKDGYFLPGSEYEKADCVRSLRQRAAEILEAADGIEEAAGLD